MVINRLTECEVSGDRRLAAKYVSTLALTLAGIAAAVVAAASLAVPMLPWATWLRIDAVAEAMAAIWAACGFTALGLLAGLAGAIYTGHQESHRNVAWDGVAKLATLAASFLVVLMPSWGTVGVLTATTGVPVMVRLVNLAWLLVAEKPWLRPTLAGFDRGLLGGLLLLLALGPCEAVLRRLTHGADVPVSTGLVLATTAMFAYRAWADAFSTALNAAGVLRPQLAFYVIHALLNLAVSAAVVGRFGATGVAWATAITSLATSVWGYPMLFRREILSGRPHAPTVNPEADVL